MTADTWQAQGKTRWLSYGVWAYVISWIILAFLILFQPEKDPMTRECVARHRLEGHKYAVGCLAWSLDDSVLLTSSDNIIRMWNAMVSHITVLLFILTHFLAWRTNQRPGCSYGNCVIVGMATRRLRLHIRRVG
jgi:hypothetical protein